MRWIVQLDTLEWFHCCSDHSWQRYSRTQRPWKRASSLLTRSDFFRYMTKNWRKVNTFRLHVAEQKTLHPVFQEEHSSKKNTVGCCGFLWLREGCHPYEIFIPTNKTRICAPCWFFFFFSRLMKSVWFDFQRWVEASQLEYLLPFPMPCWEHIFKTMCLCLFMDICSHLVQ